jgi:hypothetical protein
LYLQCALPRDSLAEHSFVLLSLKVTVPVGVEPPRTLADSVT